MSKGVLFPTSEDDDDDDDDKKMVSEVSHQMVSEVSHQLVKTRGSSHPTLPLATSLSPQIKSKSLSRVIEPSQAQAIQNVLAETVFNVVSQRKSDMPFIAKRQTEIATQFLIAIFKQGKVPFKRQLLKERRQKTQKLQIKMARAFFQDYILSQIEKIKSEDAVDKKLSPAITWFTAQEIILTKMGITLKSEDYLEFEKKDDDEDNDDGDELESNKKDTEEKKEESNKKRQRRKKRRI